MRKYIINILTLLTACLTLSACFDDDTTLATRPLAEIVLDTLQLKKEYNIDKNETLTITPDYTQTNGGKPVTTTWEINQKVYSNEPTLTFTGTTLGSWQCRLILENEDGKTFYTFKLNVNSPYEEGITILSKDPEGRPYLAFLPKTLDGSTPEFFDYDCLTTNNSDTHFASNPSDLVQSAGTLIFCCQGNGTDSDVPTIYYLNEKTLVVENMLRVTEYPDFQPTILGIPSMDASGVAYPILCANGKTYEFSTTEGAIVKPTKLQYTYAQDMIVRDNGSGWNYELLVWDKEIGGLAQIYNGYGPYYCSKNYHQTRATCTGTNNYFDGRNFCKMTYIRMTPEQASTNDHQCLVITNNGMLVQKTILSTSFWTYNFDTSETILSDNGGSTIACVGQSPVTEATPTIANRTYFSLLFGDGNKVRRWNYTTNQLLTNADVLLTVGTSSDPSASTPSSNTSSASSASSTDAIITGFELSTDHKTAYVSFYEPSLSGKNGSLWLFDTDTGSIIARYDHICYQPVKMIYKKK